jgi:hypothetical protein
MTSKKIVTGQDLLRNPDIAKFLHPSAPAPTPPAPTAVTQVPPPPEKEQLPNFPDVLDTVAEPAPLEDPKDKYLAELKRVGVTPEQAAQIIDAMLFQGAYEEDVQLTRKISVRFRTRDVHAADRLNEAINRDNPQFTNSLYTIIANYNLAASLVGYGPHKFDPSTEEGFNTSFKYITTKIPHPVYQLIVTKLSKFDEKLATIMKEGCVEDFF